MLLAALLTGLAAAGATQGQQPTEVIVRANRFTIYRGDTAFSMVDLNRADIGRAGSVDQALKVSGQASLFRRSSSLTANPTVQGLSLRAIAPSGAGRALVTLDGIPQNDPFGGWVIWAGMPQEAIQHAHVVRGAGGGAYGAGALTGVVDLDVAPPQAVKGYLDVRAGESGNSRVAAGGAMGGLALYAVDQTLHGDAVVRDPQRGAADIGTFGHDDAVLLNYQADLCPFQTCGRLDVLANRYVSQRDTGLSGASATSRGGNYSVSFTTTPTTEANGLRVQVWHKDSDFSNRSVSVAARRIATSLANDQVATPATGDGLAFAVRHQGTAVEWEAGLNAQTTEGRSEEYYRYMPKATRYRMAGGRTSTIGLYGEGDIARGGWHVTGAVRVDQWRSFDGHRSETDLTTGIPVLDLRPPTRRYTVPSGRLGVTYALAAQTALRAAVYTGFRPPSLNELYRPFRVGNDVTEANADLKPEVLDGAEIGVRHGRLIDAGLFWNVVRDPVGNVTVGTGPATFPAAGFIPVGGTLRQRRNVGRIAAWGVEMQGRYPIGSQTALRYSGTWTRARVEASWANPQLNGKRPAQAPDYSVSFGLDTSWRKVNLEADLTLDGRAFEDDLNTLSLKPSRRLNLRADYAVTPHVAIYAILDNALDDGIQTAHAGDGTLSYDNRRTVSIGMRFTE